MKSLILLAFLLIVSCTATKNTALKFYENDDFKFNYPSTWILLNRPLVVDHPKVFIAPKKNVYYESTMTHKEEKKTGSYSNNYFCVYKDKTTNKEEFIETKKNQLLNSQNNNYSYKLLKINKNQYTLYFDTNPSQSSIYKKQYFKIYYFFQQDDVYSIMFIATSKDFYTLENDIKFIENSFVFKNPETPLIPRPTP
jgi:hypothetical protein